MRKQFIFILLSILFYVNVNAQIDSTYYEKGKFGFSFTTPSINIGERYSSLSLNIRPEIFIAKQLSLGVELGAWMNNWGAKS